MAEENRASQSALRRAWKWFAGAFTALLAVAGFASPEFRRAICLDLPSANQLRYAPEPASARSFKLISTQSRQPALDGEQLVFRARYFGETFEGVYKPALGPEKQKGFAYLNLRPLDFVAEGTPLGSTSTQLPEALVLMPIKEAEELDGLPQGAIIEVRGVGRWLDAPELGSAAAATGMYPSLQDTNDFYVLADEVQVLIPVNAPQTRRLCRLFHDL